MNFFAGIDDLLSKHISHLFIRDPLVVFSETIDQDDKSSSDHFEVGYTFNPCVLFIDCFIEHPINKLANITLQASST